MAPAVDKEAAAQQAREQMEALKKRYKVRGFKTTTESITFTRKMAKAISSLEGNFEEIEDLDISEALDVFDPELIKYVVDNFVLVKEEGAKKAHPVNYEKEFIGRFNDLMLVFMIAVERLNEKVSGGKPEEKPAQGISSTKRPRG